MVYILLFLQKGQCRAFWYIQKGRWCASKWKSFESLNNTYMHVTKYPREALQILVYSVIATICSILILTHGDIESDPGPVHIDSVDASTTNSTMSDKTFDISENFSLYLSLIHLNIKSIRHKCDIINAELHDFDVLCFTESWLDENIPDSEITLDGFKGPIRCDRHGRLGGGVVVYCKKNIPCIPRPDLAPRGLECVWIEIYNKHDRYLIGTFIDHQTVQ